MSSILSSVAGPLIGGLLGGSEDAPTQTQTSNTLDPRIAKYVYGDSSTTGILPSAADWFNQNKSGLNQQMIDGLNRQYNVYSDPNVAQGYTNQQNLGQALLGAGIAGNPFTDGRMTLGSNQVTNGGQIGGLLSSGGQASPVVQQQIQNPATQQQPTNPFIYTPQPAAPAPQQQAAPQFSTEALPGISPLVGNILSKLSGVGQAYTASQQNAPAPQAMYAPAPQVMYDNSKN